MLLVILTARGEEDDRIRGLQEGADDYIVKPFSPGELVARMQALVRRKQISERMASSGRSRTAKSSLILDPETQRACLGARFLKIGPREYDLLYLLVTNAGDVLSKQMLTKVVFPENAENDTRFVDVYVGKLNEALGYTPDSPKILSEGTEGYKFVGACSIVRNAFKELAS